MVYDMCLLVCTAAESDHSLVLLRKMAGRTNFNDLEIPGGERSIYVLRLSFSQEKISWM